jgi:HEPN domain-containing protein
MVDPKIIQEWLKKADDDFDFAVSVIDESSFYSHICFHFHQSAEKYLKAIIVADAIEFKKIHDLVALLKMIIVKRSDFKELTENCKLLSPYYIDTRYPVHWPTDYTKETAIKAKDAAEKIRNRVRSILLNTGDNLL